MSRPRLFRSQPPPPAGPPLGPREVGYLIFGVLLLEVAAVAIGTETRLSEWQEWLTERGWMTTIAGEVGAAQSRRLLGLLYTVTFRLLQLGWMVVVWRLLLRRSWEDLGLRPGQSRLDARWTLVTCGAFGVLALLGEFAGFISGEGDVFRQYLLPGGQPDVALRRPPYAIWHFIVYGAIGPAAEEVFFRAIVYRRLAELSSARVAVFASAIIFAFAHLAMNPLPVVEFIGGLAFAGLFARTRSLLPPIAVHAAGNSAILAIHYLYL
ncbi:MAG: CPBP family intramembrane metalloprotease [Planctomycetes bacterium]|nr:CPBP family intramembrane metalloprotease [Planctomycetota bacterium]